MDIQFLRKFFPDKLYLEIMFYAHFKQFFSLRRPVSLNEKIQWLKLYDRNPNYIKLVDKVKVKDYVAGIIGQKYIIPTLATWDKAEDINLELLPNEFVLKCNHDSHCVFVCSDKNRFDIVAAREKLRKRLNFNMYWYGREWPYKNVHPRIIAEEYIESINGLLDFRVYCINGSPFCIYVYKNSGEDTGKKPEVESCDIYDTEWKRMAFRQHYGPSKDGVKKPDELAQMLELSRKLSEGTLFLRCDFYILEGKLVVGELTLFPGGGFSKFIPAEYDEKIGALLHLEVKK